MSDNIIQLNQDLFHNELKELVRGSVEETLNALLDHEADELIKQINMSVQVNARVIIQVIMNETLLLLLVM